MDLLVEVRNTTRFATEAEFARWWGAAPVAVLPSGAGPLGTASGHDHGTNGAVLDDHLAQTDPARG
jgi:hypothetical protein